MIKGFNGEMLKTSSQIAIEEWTRITLSLKFLTAMKINLAHSSKGIPPAGVK